MACRPTRTSRSRYEQGDAIGGLFANGNDCGGTYAHVYSSRFTGLHMGRTLSFAWHIAHELAGK